MAASPTLDQRLCDLYEQPSTGSHLANMPDMPKIADIEVPKTNEHVLGDFDIRLTCSSTSDDLGEEMMVLVKPGLKQRREVRLQIKSKLKSPKAKSFLGDAGPLDAAAIIELAKSLPKSNSLVTARSGDLELQKKHWINTDVHHRKLENPPPGRWGTVVSSTDLSERFYRTTMVLHGSTFQLLYGDPEAE